MPTYDTVVDSFLRHAGALIYIVVLSALVIYLVYCCVLDIREGYLKKRGQKNAEIRTREHRDR